MFMGKNHAHLFMSDIAELEDAVRRAESDLENLAGHTTASDLRLLEWKTKVDRVKKQLEKCAL